MRNYFHMQASARTSAQPLSQNTHLLNWVEKMAALTKPEQIHWVDGSQEEYDDLCGQLVAGGTFIKLNQDLWPGCYYSRSDSGDVARVEDRTFICSLSKDGAGPTNNGNTRGQSPQFPITKRPNERVQSDSVLAYY